MSKYEIENLKQIYLYNNVKETKGLCFPKNELAITEVLDAFCDCIPFERPDGYCIYKETLYLFEHFAIDSSVNDKGSSYMRQKHREDNLYEKFKVSEKLNKVQMITVEESFEDYIKNYDKAKVLLPLLNYLLSLLPLMVVDFHQQKQF